MTERELKKLRRRDLLQLLLVQSREAEEMRRQRDRCNASLKEAEAACEELRQQCADRDAQVHDLLQELREKDALLSRSRREAVGRLTAVKAGSLAEAAVQVSGLLQAAQSAADLYLREVRRSRPGRGKRRRKLRRWRPRREKG